MKLDNLNKWLTLLANFGVIAGVIFLAVEVRQNQITLEESNQFNFLQMRATSLETFNDFRALVVQDEDVSRLWFDGLAGIELSESDERRFEYLCTSRVWLAVTQYERGAVLGEATTEGQIALQAQALAQTPGYRKCWENNKAQVRLYGFGEYVDAVEGQIEAADD